MELHPTENKSASLSERQIMMLSHVMNTILRDPDKVVSAVRDVRGTLKNLGATDDDIKAIAAFFDQLEAQLKRSSNVGFW
jgi:hypothetical protein